MRDDIIWKGHHLPIDEAGIRRVEEHLGIRLPADYVEYAQLHHGGRPDINRFDYRDPTLGPVETCLGELLSLDLKRSGNILETYRWLSSQLPPGIVPFASDPGGDFICFDYRNPSTPAVPSVVYWMHERDGGEAIVPLAPSFTDFLNMLRDRPARKV